MKCIITIILLTVMLMGCASTEKCDAYSSTQTINNSI
jgi:hypothetical protein